jgi:hypothetical protein
MSGNPAQRAELVRLLHEVDGHLGLAVHRGNGHLGWWKKDADKLIGRIRQAIKELEASDG